jgi:hypothetical protein
MRSLVWLSLCWNSRLRDQDPTVLQALAMLEHLDLSDTFSTDRTVDGLGSLTRLVSLNLRSTVVKRPELRRFHRLRSVNLSYCTLEALRLPAQLEHLDLHGTYVSMQQAPSAWCCHGVGLKTLDLRGFTLDWQLLEAHDVTHVVVTPAERNLALRCFPRANVTEKHL